MVRFGGVVAMMESLGARMALGVVYETVVPYVIEFGECANGFNR